MARYLIRTIVASILVLALAAPLSFASEEELMKEIAALKAKVAEVDALKARVAQLEKQVDTQKCDIISQAGTVKEVKEALIQSMPSEKFVSYEPGAGVTLPSCGIRMQADATFLVQGTPNANNVGDSRNKSRTDASWSSDIYIEKAFDDWGLALIHLEPGQGDALEGDLSVYSNVNRDSGDSGATLPVTELWYEHYLFDKQVTLTAGKIDASNYLDQNEFAYNETTQFLGRMFRNSPAVEWPNDNALGGSVAVAPAALPFLAANVTYVNANNTYEDIFDRVFVSSELVFKAAKAFGWDESMWGGNYRAYWWYNGLDHAKLVAAGEPPSDDAKERNTGFGVSFDQRITDRFGVFARVS